MTTTLSITLTTAETDQLAELAREWNTTPEAIVEAFIADLTASSRSGGSDERSRAEDWFNRSCSPAWGDEPQRFWARASAAEIEPQEQRRIVPQMLPVDDIHHLAEEAAALMERMRQGEDPQEEWAALIEQLHATNRLAGPGLAVGKALQFREANGVASYIIDRIDDEKVHTVHIPMGDSYTSAVVDEQGWCQRSVAEENIRRHEESQGE